MNILTYTNLYPNDVDPSHGLFVERRLLRLRADTGVRPVVVAPVPWFPFKSDAFGRRAALARIAGRNERHGVTVHHPRYPLLPKIGMSTAPWLMAAGTAAAVRRAIAEHGGIDLVDAHYFYPDGVAAARIARSLGLPYVITARGSDINLVARHAWPRRLMLGAAAGAAALIAVSEALAAEMRRIGMPADRIHVLRNGVDLEFFTPGSMPRATGAPEFLSVGTLKEAKGHDVAIRFVAGLPGARLVIAGGGPDATRLTRLAEALGVADRVALVGILGPADLRDAYRRADALILMSRREGMPNVVLESLACGTPVLAAKVGGIAEVVDAPAAGELVAAHDAQALARAWQALQSRGVDRQATRRHAERFSWRETIAGLDRLLSACVRGATAKNLQESVTKH